MKKKGLKKNVFLTSILTIALCLSLCVGGTFALFTSEDTANITVTSGKVKVSATIDAQSIETSSMGVVQESGKFENGGAFTADAENIVTLDRVTPGDKVTFNMNIVSDSNVATKYRSKVTCVSGYELYGLLNVTFDGLQPTWKLLPAGEQQSVVAVTIELASTVGNEAQDLSTQLVFAVEAVQGNADVEDEVVSQIEQSSNGSVVVPADNTQDVVVKTDTGAVKVNVPASRVDTVTNKIDVNVTPIVDQVEQAKFTISSGADSVYYDIDVAGMNASADNCTVDMFVGKGLVGVSVYHNDKGVVSAVEGATYNEKTGYVTFQTSTFSPFAIEAFDSKLYSVLTRSEARLTGKGTAEENGNALTNAITYIQDTFCDIYLADGQYDMTQTSEFVHANNYLSINGNGDNTVINIKNENAYFEATEKNSHGYFKNVRVNANDYVAFLAKQEYAYIYADGGVFTCANGKIGKAVNGGEVVASDGYYYSENNAELFEVDSATNGSISVSGGIFKTYNPVKYLAKARILSRNVAEDTYTVLTKSTLKFEGDVKLENDIYVNPTNSFSDLTSVYNIDENLNLDLNGHGIYFVYDKNKKVTNVPALFFVRSAVEVNIFGNGKIDVELGDNTAYVMDIQNVGAVVNIENGTFTASPTAFQVNQGTLNVKGGKFELTKSSKENSSNPKFLLNCIDKNYKNGTAKINVTGGTFVGTNLVDVEGANTTYLAYGAAVMEVEPNVFKVITDKDNFFEGDVKLAGDILLCAYNEKIIENSSLAPMFTLEKDCVLDLNGKKISYVKDGRKLFCPESVICAPLIFGVNEAVSFTINDSVGTGVVDSSYDVNTSYCVNVNNVNAVVNVNAGNFISAESSVQVRQGTLNVNGGSYKLTTDVPDPNEEVHYLINCIDRFWADGTAVINVKGGSFFNFNLAEKCESAVHPTLNRYNYVADGYVTVAEPQENGTTWYKVVAQQA